MADTGMIPEIEIPITYMSDETLIMGKLDLFSLIVVKEGYLIMTIDGKRHHVMAPALLCLNYDESVEIHENGNAVWDGFAFEGTFINSKFTRENIEKKRELELVSMDMDLFWLGAFIKRKDNYFGIIPLGIDSLVKLDNFFTRIRREITCKDNIYWPCRTRAAFMEMLFFIENKKADYETASHVHFTSLEDELIEKVIIYINSSYDQNLSISNLCQEFAVNRTTLSDRFSKTTGMTITGYISKVRVQMACNMLKETYLPITEIMLESGFSTTANFNKVFKQNIGMTPRAYRQGSRNGTI